MNTSNFILRNGQLVNEGKILAADIWIKKERIEKIGFPISTKEALVEEINAEGLYIFPGLIDDQVHFREPGLTYKGDLFTESRAAVAGGITSFMEMPNTIPPALTQELLQQKFDLGHQNSIANFSFYMGVSNDNYEEVMKTDFHTRPGIKIFLGSSTGNMLVDNPTVLEKIFSNSPGLIAVHCEDEKIIRNNLADAKVQFGENIPAKFHAQIRSAEACYSSSSQAVKLARQKGTRLHVLHISTAQELDLFEPGPIGQKNITAEACIHHLWFSDADYERLGNLIKWNPSIKSITDQLAIRKAVLEGRIDIIATDHAPHTLDEKNRIYDQCPSGGPLVQHALVALLDLYHQGHISLEVIAQKTSHSVAEGFKIEKRGFIREGYYADLTLVNLQDPWCVQPKNIRYKCGWSPFQNHTFLSKVYYTLVNGKLVYNKGEIQEGFYGKELRFSS